MVRPKSEFFAGQNFGRTNRSGSVGAGPLGRGRGRGSISELRCGETLK